MQENIENRFSYLTIIKFAILISLTEFVRGAYLNFITLYSYNKDYSEALVGAVFFAYFFMETVSKIGVGWLLDRFNNRMVLFIGLSISLISLFLYKLVVSPVLLVVAGAIYGLGFAPVWLIVLGYISTFQKERRALSMGIIYSSWLTGLGLGAVLVNFFISKSFAFALDILIIIWILCIIMGLFIREGIKNSKKVQEKKSLKDMFKDFCGLDYLIPGMMLQTLALTILMPIVPKYFIGKSFLGMSATQYGNTLAVAGAIIVVCMIVFGKLSKKIRVENLFVFGLLFTSIGILGTANAKYFPLIILFGIISSIAYSAVLPSWNAVVSNSILKDNKGVMWGFVSTLEGVGRAVGSLLGGALGSFVSLRFSFNSCAAIIFALSIFYFIKKARIASN
jgi:MFS family permease